MLAKTASIDTHNGVLRCWCISHHPFFVGYRYRDVKVLLSSQAGNRIRTSVPSGLYYFIIKNEKCNSNTKIPPELTGLIAGL